MSTKIVNYLLPAMIEALPAHLEFHCTVLIHSP
jgi:hypothetical protein